MGERSRGERFGTEAGKTAYEGDFNKGDYRAFPVLLVDDTTKVTSTFCSALHQKGLTVFGLTGERASTIAAQYVKSFQQDGFRVLLREYFSSGNIPTKPYTKVPSMSFAQDPVFFYPMNLFTADSDNRDATAWDYFLARPPAVVVSDALMPTVNGFQLLSTVHETLPHTARVLFSGETAYMQQQDPDQRLRGQVYDHFVPKVGQDQTTLTLEAVIKNGIKKFVQKLGSGEKQ